MTKKKGDDSELVKKNIKETLDKDAKTSAKRKSLKKTEQQSNKLPRKVYKEVPFLDIIDQTYTLDHKDQTYLYLPFCKAYLNLYSA